MFEAAGLIGIDSFAGLSIFVSKKSFEYSEREHFVVEKIIEVIFLSEEEGFVFEIAADSIFANF